MTDSNSFKAVIYIVLSLLVLNLSFSLNVVNDDVFTNNPIYLEIDSTTTKGNLTIISDLIISSISCNGQTIQPKTIGGKVIFIDYFCPSISFLEATSNITGQHNVELYHYTNDATTSSYDGISDEFLIDFEFTPIKISNLDTLLYRPYDDIKISHMDVGVVFGDKNNIGMILKTDYSDTYYRCFSEQNTIIENKTYSFRSVFNKGVLNLFLDDTLLTSCEIPGVIRESSKRFIISDFQYYGDLYDFDGNISNMKIFDNSIPYSYKGNVDIDVLEITPLKNEDVVVKEPVYVEEKIIDIEETIVEEPIIDVKEDVDVTVDNISELFDDDLVIIENTKRFILGSSVTIDEDVEWVVITNETLVPVPSNSYDFESASGMVLETKYGLLDVEDISNNTMKLKDAYLLEKESRKLEEKIKEQNIIEGTITRIKKSIHDGKVKDAKEKIVSFNHSINLLLDKEGKKVVKYKTEAPRKYETKKGDFNKEILIASPIHYINVTSYTNLTIPVPKELIKLYWVKNETREPFNDITYYDDNNDGLVESIAWVVPHLSNQTFELDINIINVQSYPTVGGTWGVKFTTIGTDDLIIEGVNDTTFGTHFPDDLNFQGVTCGDKIFDYVIFDNTIVIPNYYCNETGVETSIVMTPGKHHLSFTFGGKTVYAHNKASDPYDNVTQSYDATLGQDGDTGPIAISLDGETYKHGGYTHSTVTNPFRIYVNETDLYKISYACTWQSNGATSRHIMENWVRKNGLTDIIPSKTSCYVRDTETDRNRCSNTGVILANLTDGDYVELMGDKLQGQAGATVTANDCYVYVQRVRNRIAQYYDAVGGQNIDGVNITVNLGSTTYEDNSYFSVSTNQITFANTGTYKVYYQVCSESTGQNSRSTPQTWIRLNGATNLPMSYSYSYIRQTSDADRNCEQGYFLRNFTASDYIELRHGKYRTEATGSVVTLGNQNWVVVEDITSNAMMAYESTGGQTITDGTTAAILLNNNYLIEDAFEKPTATRIALNESGLYEVSYGLGWVDDAGNDRIVVCTYLREGGSTKVNPSEQCDWSRGDADTKENSVAANFIMNVTKDTYYELVATPTGSAFSLQPQATWVSMVKLDEPDKVPPVVTLTNPQANYVNDSWYYTNVTFSCSVTDNKALTNLSLYLTNENNARFELKNSTNVSGTSNSSSWKYELLPGDYTWNCLSYDQNGNFAFATTNRTVKLNYTDSVSPWFTHSLIDFDLEYGESIYYDINATDDLFFDSYSVNDTDFSITQTGVLINNTLLSVGEHYANITINDSYGNTNHSVILVNVTDKIAPVFTSIYNITQVINTPFGRLFEAYDLSGIVNWTVNDTTNFNINSTGYMINVSFLNVGTYWLNITAIDLYNNSISERIYVNVTAEADSTPPYFDPNPTNQIVEFGVDLSYQIYAKDNIQVDMYFVNDSRFKIGKDGILMNNSFLQVGTLGVNITVNDTNNNWNWTSFTVTVQDTTSPTFTGLTNITILLNNPIRSDLNATDLSGIKNWRVNDTRFDINETGYLSNNTLIPFGFHWLNVTANDIYNNNISAKIYINVIDTKSPWFAPEPSDLIHELGSSLYLDIDASDDVAVDTFTVNNSHFSIDSAGVLQNNSIIPQGEHYINVTVNDTSSNSNWTIMLVNVTDTTVPVFTDIYNLTVEEFDLFSVDFDAFDYSGFSSWTVNDSRFTINSNGLFRLIQELPVDLYYVNITANDNNGYSVSTTIWINVTPYEGYDGWYTQQGEVRLSAAHTYVDIQPVLASKSFIILSKSAGSSYDDPDATGIWAEFHNRTSIVLHRNSALADSNYVAWQVVSNNYIDVQHYVQDYTATNSSFDITLDSAVNVSKSIVLIEYSNTSNTQAAEHTRIAWLGNLSDSNTVHIERGETGDSGSVGFSVIEFKDGTKVQKGTVGNVGSVAAPTTVNLGSAINTSSYQLLFSHSSDTTANGLDDFYVLGRVVNSNSLQFMRDNAAGVKKLQWYLLETPFSKTNNGTVGPGTITSQTVSIGDNVDLSRACLVGSYYNTGGGTTMSNAFTELNLNAGTSFYLRREGTGNTHEVAWHVTEYPLYGIRFNQSTLNLGQTNFSKGNLTSKIELDITGENTNINLTCISGNCSQIVHNFTNGITRTHLQNTIVEFTCSDQVSGSLSATYRAKSSKTLQNTVVVSCTVIADTKTPWFTPVPSNQVIEYGYSFYYDINATDDTDIYGYFVNDTDFIINQSGVLTNNTLLDLGNHSLNISVNDTSGNVNTTIIIVQVVDTKAPWFNPVPSNQSISVGISFSYDVDGYDNYLVDSYKIDNVNFSIDVNGIITNATYLTKGFYVINITINDTSGNKNWSVIGVNVTDSLAPFVVIDNPLPNAEGQKLTTIEIAANVTDASGVDKVYANISYPNGSYSYIELINVVSNKYNASFDIPFLSGQYDIRFVANDSIGNVNDTVTTYFTTPELPLYSKFGLEYGTTNFTDEPFLSAVSNMTLATVHGKINFPIGYFVDSRNENYDEYVYVNETFISANLSGLHSTFNATANITFSDVNCSMSVYTLSYYSVDRQFIVDNGELCTLASNPTCEGVVCQGNTLTFKTSSVNAFAVGYNTGLVGWDTTKDDMPFVDANKVYLNKTINFYANYTFNNKIVNGSTCTIEFNNSPSVYDMTYNNTGYFQFNTSFDTEGKYRYTITCNKSEYKKRFYIDTFTINRDTRAPWFDPKPTDQSISSGSSFSYDINASDNVAVDRIWINDTTNFQMDGNGLIQNNTLLTIGVYYINISVNDTYGNMNSTVIAVAVTDYAPSCPDGNSPCVANSSQLLAHGGMGGTSEPNAPNTIDSCNDGGSGTYGTDESLENITITSKNDTIFRVGDTVEVKVNVHCYDGTNDYVKFVYTNSTATINWIIKNTVYPCPAAGYNEFTHEFVLDNNIGMHAFRGIIQYQGTATWTCATGGYDDNDDLSFYVWEARDEENPQVHDVLPENGTVYNYSDPVKIEANVSDNKGVDYVYARIVSGAYTKDLQLNDTNADGVYDAFFTETTIIGNYNVTIIANDTSGNINNTEVTDFVVVDNQNLTINPLGCVPDPVEITNQVICSANVTDEYPIGFVYANVTLPNGTVYVVSTYNQSSTYKFNFSNTSFVGKYDVKWWANNSRSTARTNIDTFNALEYNNPLVTIISPIDYARYNTSDLVNVTVNVTDDTAIDYVYVNVTMPDNTHDNATLVHIEGNRYFVDFGGTTQVGIYELKLFANDTSGNINYTETVHINVSYVSQSALYCEFSPCIVNSSLIASRGNMATPEPNAPNTIDSCSDGNSGTYRSDESLENITMRSLNGSVFNEGDTIEVNITAFCYGVQDAVKFVYSNDSLNLNWRLLDSQNCAAAGVETVSRTFVLDKAPGIQAFRGIVQYQGTADWTCGSGSYDDNDDFEFLVRDATPPTVILDIPMHGDTIYGYDRASVDLVCNVTDSFALQNISLYLTNSTNQSFAYNGTQNLGGKSGQGIWNYDLPLGNYSFNCLAYDDEGNMDWGDNNYSFEVKNIDTYGPVINLMKPNNTMFNQTSINFSYVAYDDYSETFTCNLSVDSVIEDSVIISNNTAYSTVENIFGEGIHYWNVTCIDQRYNVNTSKTFNFTIDLTPPIISYVAPTDTSGIVVTRDYILVNVTQNDLYYNHSIFRLYNRTGGLVTEIVRSDITNTYVNWSSLDDGMYFVNVTAYDLAGNHNTTETRNVTVDTQGPQVKNLAANPDVIGLGQNTTIFVTITEDSGLNHAIIEITNPLGVKRNYTLVPTTGDNYEYVYSSYLNGSYSVRIYTENTLGIKNDTETTTFRVYSNAKVQIKTMEDSYAIGQIVNLTDPPIVPNIGDRLPIHLKSRDINTSISIEEYQENLLKTNVETINGPIYKLLYFGRKLQDDDKEILNNTGIKLIEYVPDDTWIAKVSNYSSLYYASQELGQQIIPFDYLPEDKMTSDLLQSTGADSIDLLVYIYDDVPESLTVDILKQYGSFTSYSNFENIWLVSMSENDLLDLAMTNEVYWIEEYIDDKRTLMNQGTPSVGADVLQISPYNLRGSGVTVAMWDNGKIDQSHDDFGNRASVRDAEGSVTAHPTAVAGPIIGDGTVSGGLYVGVAPNASLLSYMWPQSASEIISETNDAIAFGAVVSQNSWTNGEDSSYRIFCRDYDRVVRGETVSKPINVVFSAGNNVDTYGGIAIPSTAKNVISVGSNNDVTMAISQYSNFGPTDDGRIKPDIIAPGDSVTTTKSIDTYGTYGGTSLASPYVSGTIALMNEQLKKTNLDPLPSTYKSILLQTAKDLGRPGPDYIFGFGFLNATKAIDTIIDDQNNGINLFLEESLQQNDFKYYTLIVPEGQSELKLTVVWDDPVASVAASKQLVNDIDLVVKAPDNTQHYPWTLNPVAPTDNAIRTVKDDTNNIEQVVVDNPDAGLWKVYVDGSNMATSSQTFSLTASNELSYGKTTPEENQSKIENLDSTYINSYITMTVEYYNQTSSTWQLQETMVDEMHRYISPYETIALDLIWNVAKDGIGWNTSLNSFGTGNYRVKVEVLDNESKVMTNENGTYMNATYNFTLVDDLIPPSIQLLLPENESIIGVPQTRFSFIATDDYFENLKCNITVNGSVIVSDLNVKHNRTYNHTYDIPNHGSYFWNVTCIDLSPNKNANTSVTWKFNYVKKPTIDNVTLNSSSIFNLSSGNLTCEMYGINSSTSYEKLYNFYIDGSPFYDIYYSFDSVNTTNKDYIRDYSGSKNTGFNDGALKTTGGLGNSFAYSFNGIDNNINVPFDGSFDYISNFSIFAYVKPAQSTSAISSDQAIISKESSYQLFLSSSQNDIVFRLDNTDTNCLAGTPLNADQGYYLAATYDGYYMSIYVDGVLQNNCTSLEAVSNSDDLYIGSFSELSGYYNGTIDNVMVLGHVLSPEQVRLYSNETFNIIHGDVIEGDQNWTCSGFVSNEYVDSNETFSNKVFVRKFDYPNITSIELNDEVLLDEEILLKAGSYNTIGCSGLINIYGNSSKINLSATIYSNLSQYSLPDNMTNHYSNQSCSLEANGNYNYNYTCSFSMMYFADAGNWTCIVNATDEFSYNTNNNDTSRVMELIALNVSQDIIGFALAGDNDTGVEDFNMSVYNIGNVEIDVIAYPYADVLYDGLSMNCTTGNLTDAALKYSLTQGVDYDLKTPLDSAGSTIDMNIGRTTNMSLESYSNMYLGIGTEDLTGKIECKGHLLVSVLES